MSDNFNISVIFMLTSIDSFVMHLEPFWLLVWQVILFWWRPGHFGHYVTRFWILLKLFILAGFFWLHSVRGWEDAASLLPGGSSWPGSPVDLCWHLRGWFLITDGWGWEYWFPARPPVIPPWLRGVGMPSYCSLHGFHWHHEGGRPYYHGAVVKVLLWYHPSREGEVCLIATWWGCKFSLP